MTQARLKTITVKGWLLFFCHVYSLNCTGNVIQTSLIQREDAHNAAVGFIEELLGLNVLLALFKGVVKQ